MQALTHHQGDIKKYSLEFHLVFCHYLTLAKKDGKVIWAVKGNLVTMSVLVHTANGHACVHAGMRVHNRSGSSGLFAGVGKGGGRVHER